MSKKHDPDPYLCRPKATDDRYEAVTPECDTVWLHVFQCALCGKVKDNNQRREPDSVICKRCVEESGLET